MSSVNNTYLQAIVGDYTGDLPEPSLDECKQIFSEDYYPYNAGELVSTTSKKLVSKGRNLFDKANAIQYQRYFKTPDGTNYVWLYSNDSKSIAIPCEPNTTYTISANGFTTTIMRSGCISEFPINNSDSPTISNVANWSSYFVRTLTTTSDAKYIIIQVAKATMDDFIEKLQVEKGSTATDYTPYKQPVELVTDYGVLRSAGSVYDYVDLDRAVIVRRVGTVDLGTLNWTRNNTSRFYAYLNVYGKPSGSYDDKTNVLCVKYDSKTLNQIFAGTNGISLHSLEGKNVWVYDSEYDDPTALKTAMSGVYLYYELATPTEEPITVKGNTLSVEAGGTLTFVSDQDYHLPVPNEVEYYVQLDEIENLVNAMYLSDLEELTNDL